LARKAEPDKNDADVLDGRPGQQAFGVVLHQSLQHAEHGAEAADREHQRARPPGQVARKVEHDADEAVDGDLGHHAAHQR
jgi:hypothetical protein